MLRERMVAWLAAAFTWTALRVAPKPRVPFCDRFKVNTAGHKADLTVTLLFVPAELGEWHVTTVVEHDKEDPLLVDAAIGRCWVWPLHSREHFVPVARALKPEYVVEVRTTARGHFQHSTIGPVTCVTLAKRLIGVHNPGIVTSRQLLAKLWEMHYGCS